MSTPMLADPAFEPTSIEDREARVEEIEARLTEMDNEHAGTVMPEASRDEWNALNGERDRHVEAVVELKARKARIMELSGNQRAGQTADPRTASFVPSRGNEIYDLARIRADARSEDDHREALHANAKRAIDRASIPSIRGQSRERVQEHVHDLLARCDDKHGSLARRILATGSPVYDRAFGKAVIAGSTITLSAEEQRAMSTTNTEGGFAVPFTLDASVILTSDGVLSPMRQIARVEQITTTTWQGITSAGITVTRSGEADEAGDNDFEVAQPEVTPTRVIATVEFSVEIDQDWSGLRSEIARLLADAKEVEEGSSFVVGSGVGDIPEGVVTGLVAGSEVAMGTAGTLDVEDLYNLESELPVRFRPRARFLANKQVYNKVRDLSTGSDGGDLWVRLASGQPSELIGYPAHEASEMSSIGIGTPGDRVLLFGDFMQFIIVDRIGMLVELQPHVLGAGNRRWTGQRAINAIWRNTSEVLVDNAFRVLTDAST